MCKDCATTPRTATTPGEHFTPREVVRLMVALILSLDVETLHRPGIVRTVSDPCSGTGGNLTTAKDRIPGAESPGPGRTRASRNKRF